MERNYDLLSKSKFEEDGNVRDFIRWIRPKLDKENNFTHSYFHRDERKDYSFNSIYSAYSQYNWNNKDYYETKKTLDDLSKRIKENFKNGNQTDVYDVCIEILKWGGVLPSNKEKLNGLCNQNELISYFKKTRKIFNYDYINKIEIKDEKIFMSSGFTKIYSLLYDNFIIYDTRVAAAIALLVKTFLDEKHNGGFFPHLLNFAVGNARVGKRDEKEILNSRNPSEGIIHFKKLYNNPWTFIESNVRANWLLKMILNSYPDSKFGNEIDSLRKLESALFMIGYRVK